jgi:iron complex outermembrane receptor protein
MRAALIVALVHASGAPAQEAKLEQVLVTGTRITTAGLGLPAPSRIATADDIDATGVANIQDLLAQYPSIGTPSNRTNENFRTDSAGVATVDLRNLGVQRTLVLVNGRRFVAGIPGSSTVDLNSIPQQFIERVDVISGGASAVYGSDAVAGVVNVIYRTDFEGVEIDAQYGSSAHGDDEQYQASLTIGAGGADGRGNIVVHAGYSDQGAVYSRDRERTATDQASLGAIVTGQAQDMFTALRPFYSSFAPQGRFCSDVPCSDANSFTYDAGNNLIEGFSTNGTDTRAPDGYNRAPFRTIAMPVERYLFATQGTFEIADSQRMFVEGTYASSQATSELEPYPLGSNDIYAGTEGWVPLEFEALVDDPDNPGQTVSTVLRNPLVPQTIYDATVDRTGDGLRDLFFTRRLSEIGNRGSVADRDTFRVVAGLQGELPALDGWVYEVFYAHGQTKESQTSRGQVNELNFRHALEAIPDVADVDGDGDVSEAICRDATARAQGCVPASLFGRGALSPAAVRYINAPGSLAASVEQKVAGLNLNGRGLELPAGRISFALGVEYRDEHSRSEFDPLQQAGLNAGPALPRIEGGFDVHEYYVEANVPILADLRFADTLNTWAAYRLSDYSTVGQTDSWNVGLEWSPSPQVRFRGVRSQSTRAPNVNELFMPPSGPLVGGVVDPCEGVTLVSTGEKDERCRAAPGVLDNILSNVDPITAPDGVFTVSEADFDGTTGFEFGVPGLSEETGESWTFGVVLTPTAIEALGDFALTIDYSRIEIDGAIAFLPQQYAVEQCYSGDQSYCRLVTRRASAAGAWSAGSLDLVNSPQANTGGLRAESIDTTMTYAQDLGTWGLNGRLNASLTYTRVLEGYLVPIAGFRKDQLAGEVGNSKDRANLSLGYAIEDFALSWRVNYIGRADLDDQFLLAYGLEPNSVGIGSVTYHDVQVAWSPGEALEFYVGATNLFDETPPPILFGVPNSTLGTETDAGTYDAIGQRFYGGVRVKF